MMVLTPELIALLVSLLEQLPAEVAAAQAVITMLKSGGSPTAEQVAELQAQIVTDRAAAEAAIAAAGG
jgi:hypothetical protein